MKRDLAQRPYEKGPGGLYVKKEKIYPGHPKLKNADFSAPKSKNLITPKHQELMGDDSDSVQDARKLLKKIEKEMQ